MFIGRLADLSQASIRMSDWHRSRSSSTPPRPGGARIACGMSLAIALLAGASGCVQRQLTIRTNPPGALVFIDEEQIGVTPCSTSFTYYGTRKVRIVKDGYETLTTYQKISTPWYEWPGIDFISENLWPGEIRDDRTLSFQLEPQKIVPPMELISRGENLRQGGRMDGYLAPGAVIQGPDGSIIVPPGACPPGFMPKPPCPTGHEPPRMAPFSGQ